MTRDQLAESNALLVQLRSNPDDLTALLMRDPALVRRLLAVAAADDVDLDDQMELGRELVAMLAGGEGEN